MDELTVVKDLLTDNWDSTNTDDLTPTIEKIVTLDKKRIDLSKKDYVLIYAINHLSKPYGIGTNKETEDNITIDVRTMFLNSYSLSDIRSHAIKVKDEVIRILDGKILVPPTNFSYADPSSIRDLTDRTKFLGRFVIEYKLKRWGVSRTQIS